MNRIAPPDDRFRFPGSGHTSSRRCTGCDQNKSQFGGTIIRRWGSQFWYCSECKGLKKKATED